MNGFKKLILTSAILAASSSAMAMQAMDDESLSSTTGQDGLTVMLTTDVTTDITWVDRTGTAAGLYTEAGAVFIDNLRIRTTDLRIDIDAGGDAGDASGEGMLNIGITNTTAITIDLGNIGVADAMSDTSGNLAARSTIGGVSNFITFNAGAQLTIAAAAPGTRLLDIQLGNEATNFMTLNGDLGDITLTGLNIIDADGGAGADISIGTLSLANIDLVDATVNVIPGGLEINTGNGLTNVTVGIERLALGDETLLVGGNPANGFIGDIYLTGLNLTNNTITVRGH